MRIKYIVLIFIFLITGCDDIEVLSPSCLDGIEKFEYIPETKIEYQPGIMLGTLELLLNFTKK